MAAPTKTHAPHAHPVILLARAIGILLGVLVVLTHGTLGWAAIAGLAGYSVTLWSLRGRWPAPLSTPAAKPR